jgi:integrase
MPQVSDQQLCFFFVRKGACVSELRRKSAEFQARSRAAATRRAYDSDWRAWLAWCAEYGCTSLPASAETVSLYLADQSERLAVATLERRVVAIALHHREAGAADPCHMPEVREVLGGLRRSPRAPSHAKAALGVSELRRLVRAARERGGAGGLRDAALLLVGWAGAFRRSELVGFDLSDVSVVRAGAVLELRRSKTDQEGRGRAVPIPRGRNGLCPVRALERWIRARGSWPGPLFTRVHALAGVQRARLSGQGVARVVQGCAGAAGLDPGRYGGHSLRAGLVTAAHEAGRSDLAIMQTTGHRSVQTLSHYVRKSPAGLFRQAAAAGLLR